MSEPLAFRCIRVFWEVPCLRRSGLYLRFDVSLGVRIFRGINPSRQRSVLPPTPAALFAWLLLDIALQAAAEIPGEGEEGDEHGDAHARRRVVQGLFGELAETVADRYNDHGP